MSGPSRAGKYDVTSRGPDYIVCGRVLRATTSSGRTSSSAGSIAGNLYNDSDTSLSYYARNMGAGVTMAPTRTQPNVHHDYIGTDYNQDELLGRRSRSRRLPEFVIPPPRSRSSFRLFDNKIIDDDELFMEFTMKKNKKLIKDIPGSINFMILGQNEALMQCRMKIMMPFRKLMRLYAESLGISRHVLLYKYQGDLVEMPDSPMSIDLEEGDTIVVSQRRIKSITIATEVLD